ncbi:MAG: hypothetical protein HZC45_09205 [Deltaproteobacteria bacterium]|nr:hypothetical protein [Deltaproteobacteria bacterium]
MTEEKKEGQSSQGINLSRRLFVKKAVIGGIAVISTASIAKKVVSTESEKAQREAYIKDEFRQDMAMKNMKFVLMTDDEKRELADMFVIDYYKEQA